MSLVDDDYIKKLNKKKNSNVKPRIDNGREKRCNSNANVAPKTGKESSQKGNKNVQQQNGKKQKTNNVKKSSTVAKENNKPNNACNNAKSDHSIPLQKKGNHMKDKNMSISNKHLNRRNLDLESSEQMYSSWQGRLCPQGDREEAGIPWVLPPIDKTLTRSEIYPANTSMNNLNKSFSARLVSQFCLPVLHYIFIYISSYIVSITFSPYCWLF